MKLEDIKAIITGGTSGIGYETAKMLKSHGAQVVICGRDQTTVQQAAEALNIKGFAADVSNESNVLALFEYAIAEMNGLNVLINNAGIGGFSKLVDATTADFQKIWEINVKGLFMAGRAAAQHFITQDYGNIINIGSTASQRGFAQGSAYVASKFAVSGLTECWRAELRPHHVRVMQVNPSEVVTDFGTKLGMAQQNEEGKLKPQQIAHVIEAMLRMDDVGFIPDAAVWATHPW